MRAATLLAAWVRHRACRGRILAAVDRWRHGRVSWLFCGWGPGYGSYVSERKRGAGIPQSPLASLPPPFDRLTSDDAAVLSQRTVPVEFAAGSCIFKAGTIGDCCFVIDSGVVRIDVDRSELPSDSEIDDETALAFVEAGELLGELALLDQLPRSASAYAFTDVRARRIDATVLDEFTRTHRSGGRAHR